MSFWKKTTVSIKTRKILLRVFITRLINRYSEKDFWPVSIGLVEEVCSPVSFQRHHFTDGTASDHSLGARSLSQATFGYGMLHTARYSCTKEAFCRPPATKRGKGTVLPRNGPNPRVGTPYTYLMVWFALHYPAIIQPREEPPQRVFGSRTSAGSKGLRGNESMWPRYVNYCAAMTCTVFSDASPISEMLVMVKSSRMPEIV